MPNVHFPCIIVYRSSNYMYIIYWWFIYLVAAEATLMWVWKLLIQYSKALRCTVSSNTGLAYAWFLIGFKIIWDTRIYAVKTLSCTILFDYFAHILLSNPSCTKCELHGFFFWSPKTCISRPCCSKIQIDNFMSFYTYDLQKCNCTPASTAPVSVLSCINIQCSVVPIT